MKTPGNWARPETWLENTLLIFFSTPCKIQGIFFAKKVVGHNFWTEGPTDLRLTFLSCIFDGLFGDTPLGHIFFTYAHMPIWAYFDVLDVLDVHDLAKVCSEKISLIELHCRNVKLIFHSPYIWAEMLRSYKWMGWVWVWVGSLWWAIVWAPLCGANKECLLWVNSS